MSEHIKYLELLIAKQEEDKFGPYRFIAHAIFNTMDVATLVNLYVDTKNLKLKNTLDNHLNNRFKDATTKHKVLFIHLMRKLNKAPYNQHQRIRVLLTYLIDHLPPLYTKKYFDFFSSTKYLNDLSAALKVSHLVWNSSSDEVFMDQFLKTGNDEYLIAVIKYGHSEEIVKRLKYFWYDESPPDFIKNMIIRKIAIEHFEKIAFLRNSEPDKYLYACAFSNFLLEDEELDLIYQDLNEHQKHFGLWCIGKMKKWQFIKKRLTSSLIYKLPVY